jgi:ribosomal protein S18 acetylase RimI-like enzyme
MSEAPPGYRIRDARAGDLDALPAIERACARLFAPWGLDVLFGSATTPRAVLEGALARGDLLVATTAHDDRAIGFALTCTVDWHAHLDELGVHPDHGRRGLGAALIEEACRRALAAGRPRMTLATMREVPFNGPWYRRIGFRELHEDELGPGLRTIFERELAGGLPMAERVFLGRDLDQGTNL